MGVSEQLAREVSMKDGAVLRGCRSLSGILTHKRWVKGILSGENPGQPLSRKLQAIFGKL